MNLIIQAQHQIFFEKHLKTFSVECDMLFIVGDEKFVQSQKKNQNDKLFILTEQKNISINFLLNYPKAIFFEHGDLEAVLSVLDYELVQHKKNLEIHQIKISTERKRAELEQLNFFLKDQSDEKIFLLSSFHAEELVRKNKEKKLIYFLDYVNSEYHRSDFILELLKTIWQDLKKIGSFYRIGFILKNINQESCIIEFDGKIDRTRFDTSTVNLQKNKLMQFLADLFKRPVGQIIQFSADRADHQFTFFFENQGQAFDAAELDRYMNDRISLLSIVVQRWYLETAEIRILKQWQKLFESYKDPVHVVDKKFNLIQSNYHSLSSSDEKKCHQILANKTEPCIGCPLINLNTEMALQKEDFQFKEQIQIKNRDYEMMTSNFSIFDKEYFFMTYVNVTERNHLRSNLIHVEKMATIGQLSNHLAHELNNPLTGLKLYAEMLIAEGQLQSPVYENDMSEVLKAIVRSQTILQDLSQFTNEKETELVSVPFADIVQKTMTLLKSILRSHRIFIDLKTTQILAQPTYLQQILFNLIKNSCQAMNGQGTLKIYQIETEKTFDFVVEDDGSGMPRHLRDNLFKPFFTTKESGQGTGLGLFLSQKLMFRMNAELIYNSSFTKGTQFILRFKK